MSSATQSFQAFGSVGLFAPHGLGGVIDRPLLGRDMSVETEHVAEVVVMEFDLAVRIAAADFAASPVIDGGVRIRDGDRVGRLLEIGDEGQVAFAAVADVAAEPFGLEVGALQRVGVDAVQTGAQPGAGPRRGDDGADEHLEVADMDAAEVRPQMILDLFSEYMYTGGT